MKLNLVIGDTSSSNNCMKDKYYKELGIHKYSLFFLENNYSLLYVKRFIYIGEDQSVTHILLLRKGNVI